MKLKCFLIYLLILFFSFSLTKKVNRNSSKKSIFFGFFNKKESKSYKCEDSDFCKAKIDYILEKNKKLLLLIYLNKFRLGSSKNCDYIKKAKHSFQTNKKIVLNYKKGYKDKFDEIYKDDVNLLFYLYYKFLNPYINIFYSYKNADNYMLPKIKDFEEQRIEEYIVTSLYIAKMLLSSENYNFKFTESLENKVIYKTTNLALKSGMDSVYIKNKFLNKELLFLNVLTFTDNFVLENYVYSLKDEEKINIILRLNLSDNKSCLLKKLDKSYSKDLSSNIYFVDINMDLKIESVDKLNMYDEDINNVYIMNLSCVYNKNDIKDQDKSKFNKNKFLLTNISRAVDSIHEEEMFNLSY